MAVVVAERVRRLAADFRSAVALVRTALRPAGRLQCRDQPARLRCRDLRLSVPRRCRDHPVVPRPRLACRRRARGCDGIRARRFGQCAHTAHRADRQPRLPAPCALARGARARALVVARGPGGRRGRWTYGDRTRSGGVAVALRARRIRAGVLGGGGSAARTRAREHQTAGRGRGERLVHCRGADHHDHAAGGALEPSRDQLRGGRGRLDPPRAPAAIRICRSLRRDGPERRILGAAKPDLGRRLGMAGALPLPEYAARLRRRADLRRGGVIRPHSRPRLVARDQVFHYRRGLHAALRARRLYAGLPPDVRPLTRRGALPPSGRRHLRAGRVDRGHCRLSRPSLAHRHGAAGNALTARIRDRRPDGADRRRAGAGCVCGRHPARARSRGDCGGLHGGGGRGSRPGAPARCALARRRGRPHRSVHGARPRLEQRSARFDALRANTDDETVRLLKARLAGAAAPDRRDRVELVGIEYHWPNLSLAQGFDHVFGHNPLRLRWFQEATHVGDTVAIASQRVFSPLYPSYRSAFADLLGVRFIATGVPVEQIDSSLKPGDLNFIARTKDAYVYENPRALPRVMLLTDWRLANFDELLRVGWPSVDPRRTVLLKKAPIGFSPGAAVGTVGTARLLRYANTEVVVEAESPAGGILLLNDVWHPWWRASIDGVDAEILKADVIFRAVVCPRGRHEIRFTFHPFAGALAEVVGKVRHNARP